MNERVRAVMRKELREYRRNKLVVGTMATLPLVFFLLPLITVVELKAGTPANTVRGAVGSALLWLLMMPLLLPTIVAGYAVVGEREQGTIEPVLTTPVRKEELLIGKALAACVPTVSVAYAFYAIFLLVVRLAGSHQVVTLVWTAAQIIALLVYAPLFALFSIWVGLAISVRSSDVRVAQQLSALAVLPMVGVIALFTFRVISPSVGVATTGAIAMGLLDVAAWRSVAGMFDPERVLTRYGRS